MADGKGCTCFAKWQGECTCDADWTPQEVIDLRAELAALDAMLNAAREAERERCAQLCASYSDDKWRIYKYGAINTATGRADCHVQGQADGAEECVAAIRARKDDK